VKLLDESARGVYIIAATPFTEQGELDLQSAASMVDFYLRVGVDGITLLGVLGEAPKLTAAESTRLVKSVIDRVAGRVPVVVGVSSPGFAAMKALADEALSAGAAGVMVAPTASLRTDDQIFDYFTQVAEVLGPIPFVLQDHPQSTGVQMSVAVMVRILKALRTCVMVKHEDWPGLAKVSALRAASASGELRRVSILGGNGGLFLPEELSRGTDGAMTGFAFPEMMVEIYRAHVAGDHARLHAVFEAYLPLARYEQQPGIGLAVRKYLLAQRGAIASATLRRPGPKLTSTDIAEIEQLLARQDARLRELA
jgi:4-hydroxy-tetrahydrodipicolinate synthase